VLGLGAVALPRAARGDVGGRLARLVQLRHDVQAAHGPTAYVSLRKLWQEWDQGEPSEVEEALDEVAADRAVSAPVRAYAGLLEAYARRRRGDLDGAKSRIAKLGYVSKWLVVGPFDNEGKVGHERVFAPESDAAPIDLSRAYDGKERPVRWRVSPAEAPFGWFDLGALVRPAEKQCSYALTYVKDAPAATGARDAKSASRPISIWAGSAGAMKVWWNGRLVLADEKYRLLDADRLAATVTLRPGANKLLVKVCGDEDAPILSLRIAGQDGAPDERITTAASPDLDVEARANAGLDAKAKAPAQALRGPLQAFEAAIAGGDPAQLEAFARYLVLTQSDDLAEHRARELARRAAEKAPTVPRLLLAGDLTEGRNQRALWIERAEALVKSGGAQVKEEDRIAVLLARGAHAQRGSNWRDAVPYYDRVLAIDPDNVAAVLARYELFSEASLRETSLAFLARAVERRPKSVALVRAMAAALRQQDRIAEAGDYEERYAQLRFDDAGFARSHIELAIARRDPAAATRWVDRMVATNPDSAKVLSDAAKSYQLLGDRPRAVGYYKRALDLAPEDTDALRQLADASGMNGQRAEQQRLLRQIVALKPQDKDAREYLANLEPPRPRPDEAYARPAAEFLKGRGAPARGFNERTLVSLQVTTVFPNGLASRFHQVVFQPLTDAAAAEAREYAFGFQADIETVQLRGARVYHPNGQTEEAVESGEGPANDPSIATYTSARAFYVHFPRLSPGDVVELQYRIEDVAARNEFADYFGEVEYMQGKEPIGRAEYVLITPKSRAFYFNKPNVPGLARAIDEKGDSRVYHFTALDVPPITPEANQPPYSELLGHVHVSTYKSWDEMARWYWGLVKDQLITDDEVKRRVAEVTKGKTTDRDKVRAVYDYVVQKTRYVALEFGIHGFKPYRCAQIFARGFGDCKDKATLIVAMLKELGIPSTLVIVRTGMRGDFETDPASLAPFDHAIAYVPSLDLYLDGTAENTGSAELPSMDRGALALQVNEGRPKLVHLPDPPAKESVTSRKVDVTMTPDGAAQVDWRAEVTGVSASSWRSRYHAEGSRKERVQEDLTSEFAGLEIGQVDASNLDDIEAKVELHVRAKAPRLGRREGDRVSLPMGPDGHMVKEYAPLAARRLDLRLHAQTVNESDWTVHLPPGAKVVSAPARAQGTSPFGSYAVEVEAGGAVAHVKTTITMTRTRIAAAEYPQFRAFCEAADRALGQRLVVSVK